MQITHISYLKNLATKCFFIVFFLVSILIPLLNIDFTFAWVHASFSNVIYVGKFGTSTLRVQPKFNFMESFIIRWGLYQVSTLICEESFSGVCGFCQQWQRQVSKLVNKQENVEWVMEVANHLCLIRCLNSFFLLIDKV